jgi:hypothetical protein
MLWVKAAPSFVMTSGTGCANMVLGLKFCSIQAEWAQCTSFSKLVNGLAANKGFHNASR